MNGNLLRLGLPTAVPIKISQLRTGEECKMGILGKNYGSNVASSTRTQRTLPRAIMKCILVLTSVSLSAVSCKTVTISSGFEKQTLQEGESFTLRCRATGLYHVTITWLLDGLPLEYTSPEPTGSVRLKADNPHSKSSFLMSEQPRYLIKNSQERSTKEKATIDDLTDDVTKESDARSKERSNSTQAISNATTAGTNILHSSNTLFKEPAPLLPPAVAFSENGMVTVSSVLALNNATVSDGGIYTCVAIDVIRNSARWSEKIAVEGPLSLRQNRPIFALIDSVVVIPCTVLGTGDDLTVRWFYQGFPNKVEDASLLGLTSLPDDHRQTVHSNGSLEIREARKANEGFYTCQVDLKGRLTNMSTQLKVMVPPKIKSFILPQVQVGKPIAEFCVVSEGDTPLDISWYKNGTLLRPNEFMEMHRSGKRALSFTISSVDLSSAGNYSCCATNNVSQICQESELVVLDPPKILDLPSRLSAISGGDVIIPCRTTGFPKPNVTWRRVVDGFPKEVAVPKLKAAERQTKRPKFAQTENGTLVIANVSSADGGKYLCRAANEVDELSRFVTLQVHNPARIVELTGTRDVVYRSDVTIECSSWGDDVVDVAWLKEGKRLPFSDRHIGATILDYSLIGLRHPVTLNRMTIKNTTRSDTGVYACKAVNKYGQSAKAIHISVRAPPSKPQNFKVIDMGTSFLRMVVSPGKDDGGSRLLAYELNFTKIFAEESSPQPPDGRVPLRSSVSGQEQKTETVTCPASTSTSLDQEIPLDRLECGSEYRMSIRATNEIGSSFAAQHLTARTMGTDPVIPTENELVVEVNQTAVVLDLRAWQNGGCPITDLTVEFARHGDTEWNVTSIDTSILRKELSGTEKGEKSGKNPGHLVISSLKPGTWYKIWSSACNNAGCNYVTHSVPTLLPNGATVPPLRNEVEKEAAESTDARYLVPMVCGFGLVLLLVLLLVFYRYKQRSKKQMRLKEARKMANKLLYKTEVGSSPSAGMRVELPERRSAQGEDDEAGAALVETSLSSAGGDEAPMLAVGRGENDTAPAPFLEDVVREHSDTLADLPTEENSTRSAPPKMNGVCGGGSGNSKKSGARVSLKDNADLAVFREAGSSDDEDQANYHFTCDESAFGDSATWRFTPGSQAAGRPNKRVAGPAATKKKLCPRRPSSSSSGTDEELAQVFGLPCSKQKFKQVAEKELLIKSDFNENYRPASLGKPSGMNYYAPAVSKIVGQEPRLSSKKNDVRRKLAIEHERANSTGMVPSANNQRHFKPLPGDAAYSGRSDCPATQHRPLAINLNPFKTAFGPATQKSPLINFHRPDGHARGHTYSHGTPQHNWNGSSAAKAPQFGNALNASPYGERQWVNTYDSHYGTTRSKPPSWGSTDLDKAGFCMPPETASHCGNRGDGSPKYLAADVSPGLNGLCQAKDCRKLDTNSPRDSGIGTDEGPGARHSASSISPPHVKGRNVQKSLESLDEVESLKSDHRFVTCSGVTGGSRGCKDSVFPPSPPLTPSSSETKLTPHVFVDISSKCNTTPTRTSRSSYPPYRQAPASSYRHLGPPKKLEYLPTPPTSPEDQPFPRARNRRDNEGWGEASLDRLARCRLQSDSRLPAEEGAPIRISTKPRNGDTTYSIKDNCTWQASTLV